MDKLYYVGDGAALQVFIPNGRTHLSDPNDPESYPVLAGGYVTLAATDTDTDELAQYGIPLAEVLASGLWQPTPPPGHPDAPVEEAAPEEAPPADPAPLTAGRLAPLTDAGGQPVAVPAGDVSADLAAPADLPPLPDAPPLSADPEPEAPESEATP